MTSLVQPRRLSYCANLLLQIKSFLEFFFYFEVPQRFCILYGGTTRYNEKLRGGAEFGSSYGERWFDIGVYCKL
jgi:hypothetical protein